VKVPVQLKLPPPSPERFKDPVANPARSVPPWWQSLQQTHQLVAKAINGNIQFGNPTSGPVNILGVWKTVTTPGVANTDFTVTHNLGNTVSGVMVGTKNAACDVYISPSANSSPTTQVILRATGVGTVLTLFLF
jgi:hypothetical protein